MKPFQITQSRKDDIEAFTNNIRKHRSEMTKPAGSALSSAHVTTIAFSLAVFRLAAISGMQPGHIQNSFKRTGIYPFDVKTMLSQFKINYKDGDWLAIMGQIADLANMMALHGEIPETKFQSLGVPRSPDDTGMPKDQLTMSRRRAVILNHTDVTESWNQYLMSKRHPEEARRAKKEATAKKKELDKKKKSLALQKAIDQGVQQKLRELRKEAAQSVPKVSKKQASSSAKRKRDEDAMDAVDMEVESSNITVDGTDDVVSVSKKSRSVGMGNSILAVVSSLWNRA